MPPSPSRAQFAFVHGMSHGAWAWAPVVTRLAAAGHEVIAVDLPGHGPRAHERRRASIEVYAATVVGALAQAGFHRAVVVGHSMAGAVIPRVAELAPARVAHLVFVAAVVLPPGGSLLSTHMSPAGRGVMRGLAAAGDGAVQYPAAVAWARWLNDLPPGDPRVTGALSRMTPQPFGPWRERVDQRRFQAMGLSRTYVRCLRDVAVPPDKAAEYAARLGVRPLDLDCAHSPMLAVPDVLVGLLERIAVTT